MVADGETEFIQLKRMPVAVCLTFPRSLPLYTAKM
jgi:hypothetical protein